MRCTLVLHALGDRPCYSAGEMLVQCSKEVWSLCIPLGPRRTTGVPSGPELVATGVCNRQTSRPARLNIRLCLPPRRRRLRRTLAEDALVANISHTSPLVYMVMINQNHPRYSAMVRSCLAAQASRLSIEGCPLTAKQPMNPKRAVARQNDSVTDHGFATRAQEHKIRPF